VGTILTGVNPMDLLCYQNIAILAKKSYLVQLNYAIITKNQLVFVLCKPSSNSKGATIS
jgi:hypothetical protein